MLQPPLKSARIQNTDNTARLFPPSENQNSSPFISSVTSNATNPEKSIEANPSQKRGDKILSSINTCKDSNLASSTNLASGSPINIFGQLEKGSLIGKIGENISKIPSTLGITDTLPTKHDWKIRANVGRGLEQVRATRGSTFLKRVEEI